MNGSDPVCRLVYREVCLLRATVMYVLYDSDCAFCRWCVAAAARRSRDLRPVPIQSDEGQLLLEELPSDRRMRAAHTVGFGGVHSRGQAVIDTLGALPRWQLLYKVARRLPRSTDVAYELVARNRGRLGKLIPRRARAEADDYLR